MKADGVRDIDRDWRESETIKIAPSVQVTEAETTTEK